jgi:hypothetical protein
MSNQPDEKTNPPIDDVANLHPKLSGWKQNSRVRIARTDLNLRTANLCQRTIALNEALGLVLRV